MFDRFSEPAQRNSRYQAKTGPKNKKQKPKKKTKTKEQLANLSPSNTIRMVVLVLSVHRLENQKTESEGGSENKKRQKKGKTKQKSARPRGAGILTVFTCI
jgi:hypothetical protein